MKIKQSILSIIGSIFFLLLFSCSEYTPKPKGYPRIEIAKPEYSRLLLNDLPYSFNVSQLAHLELPPEGSPEGWININYPSLNAKIYCSYLKITQTSYAVAEQESRSLVVRQSTQASTITEREFDNPEAHVHGTLFLLDGEVASPIQFMLTDSVSNFFRGALYYEMKQDGDSLVPVTQYIQEDIIELIQSFNWKN